MRQGLGRLPVPRLQVELEGGTVWQGRNVVQIPNEASATRFSLNDVIGGGPWPVARLQTTWNINEKHGLRLLLAPLSVTETAELQTPVTFAGSSFAAGVPTDAAADWLDEHLRRALEGAELTHFVDQGLLDRPNAKVRNVYIGALKDVLSKKG